MKTQLRKSSNQKLFKRWKKKKKKSSVVPKTFLDIYSPTAIQASYLVAQTLKATHNYGRKV
jgi:hypothetical protein